MVNFLKMSEEEKVIFLDEIFERQRQINELNGDGFIKLFFLYKLEKVYKNKKDEILKQLSGQKSNNEIMDIIVSFFKWFFLVSVCKYLHWFNGDFSLVVNIFKTYSSVHAIFFFWYSSNVIYHFFFSFKKMGQEILQRGVQNLLRFRNLLIGVLNDENLPQMEIYQNCFNTCNWYSRYINNNKNSNWKNFIFFKTNLQIFFFFSI